MKDNDKEYNRVTTVINRIALIIFIIAVAIFIINLIKWKIE